VKYRGYKETSGHFASMIPTERAELAFRHLARELSDISMKSCFFCDLLIY